MLSWLIVMLSWAMPEGDWRGAPEATFARLRVGPGLRLEITNRAGAIAEGPYASTMTKFADWHVRFTPQGSAAPFEAGQVYRLSLHFECARGREQVQLCLHAARVTCEVLVGEARCAPPSSPGPPGEAINAPITLTPP
ncbi:hypothetical protein KKF91_06070 [Myxococcota bacterium]|nr:hypothetical protein [Myxococcota bacterium]MBU1430118.1 hypothetical protein [Myxococcota bacterium]MBU1900642.1 hypothetical protein [Myxococcota bacterium]